MYIMFQLSRKYRNIDVECSILFQLPRKHIAMWDGYVPVIKKIKKYWIIMYGTCPHHQCGVGYVPIIRKIKKYRRVRPNHQCGVGYVSIIRKIKKYWIII